MKNNYRPRNTAPYPVNKRNPYIRKQSILRKGRNRMILFSAVILIFILLIILLSSILRNKNTLTGTWVYDSYTQYVFEKDGTGCLEVDDVRYDYTYYKDGKKLTLDFTENIVRDCEYTFSVRKNELTLIGGENTDGGTYTLNRSK